MTESIQNRCAHPQCNCPVSEDEEFCSPACLDAAEEGSTGIPSAPALRRHKLTPRSKPAFGSSVVAQNEPLLIRPNLSSQ